MVSVLKYLDEQKWSKSPSFLVLRYCIEQYQYLYDFLYFINPHKLSAQSVFMFIGYKQTDRHPDKQSI